MSVETLSVMLTRAGLLTVDGREVMSVKIWDGELNFYQTSGGVTVKFGEHEIVIPMAGGWTISREADGSLRVV